MYYIQSDIPDSPTTRETRTMKQLPLPLNGRPSRLAIVALDIVLATSIFALGATFIIGALAFAQSIYLALVS